MRIAVALVLFAAIAAPAYAGVDDEERARGHYEIGLGLYRLGDYRGALKEFGAGWELAHKPGFLLNLGQTYRKLGELREAREMYRQFLASVRSDDPARLQAQKVLAEIEEAIRAQPVPPSSTPPSSPSPTPIDSSPAPTSASPSPSLSGPLTPPPPDAGPSMTTSAPSVSASAPHRPRRGLRVAGVVVGVVGLGLIGGGIGTAVAADRDARDLDALDASGGAFDPSKDRAYTLDRALSTGFFVSGAVLTAGGAVLLIVSAR